MNTENKVIVLDAGNTAIKLAVFKNEVIEVVHRLNYEQLFQFLNENPDFKSVQGILSSVLSYEKTAFILNSFNQMIELTNKSILPFEINYKTPLTLGKDRICNAAAIKHLTKNKNCLSIDVGTCIKFDFISANGIYQGGSISPGIQLRYKALNDYTDNLPLLNEFTSSELIGKSTKESIHSGVMNGIQAEINNLMIRYDEEYEDLTFFMTGGDVNRFDFHRKNNIFVDENLTLKGLFYIYLLNAH